MKFLVKPVLLSAALLVGLPTASALADNGRDHRRSERHHDGWRGDRDRHHHHHRHHRGDRGWRGYDRSYYYAAPRYYRPPPVYYVRPYADPYYYEPYGAQFTLNLR